MGTYTASTFSGNIVRLVTSESNVNISANTSTVNWALYIDKNPSHHPYGSDGSWNVNINGATASGTFSYNFSNYSTLLVGSGAVSVAHNADGSKTISVSGFGSIGSAGGSATAGGSMVLTTIPRASTPTFSANPVDAGAAVTITTNRASTSFTHTIEYSIGASSGTIATGVGASTSWTVPLSLLNEIPNSTAGSITIKTTTFNGATQIGITNTTLSMSVPSSVIPSFTTITNSENTSAVSSIVGAYVQSLSTLNLAITGAAGVYNSTIASYKITVAGQTINSSSGTTGAIAASGTVPIVGTVTDSRGRTATQTVNVTVLPYANPAVDNTVFKLGRSDSSGVDTEEGTYIKVTLKASVSSLINSTEKNTLTYNIYVRQRGTSSYTLAKSVTLASHAITFNSYDFTGTYSVENAWEVRVDVVDQFSTTSISGTVATAQVFMHWQGADEGGNLAIGKFWERGAVDVLGQMYQNDGKRVLDEDDIAPFVTGGSLGSSDNLNSFTTSGQWRQDTGSNATLALHYPLASIAGSLVVESATGYAAQIFHTTVTSGKSRVFERTYNASNTSWSDWVELTPQGSNVVAFAVALSSQSQSGTAHGAKIAYDRVELNKGSAWDTTNHKFVAPTTGLYEFTLSMTQGTPTVGGPIAILAKNGVAYPSGTALTSISSVQNDAITIAYSSYVTATGVMLIELAAGDYIEAYLYNGNGTSLNINAYGNRFSGRLVEVY